MERSEEDRRRYLSEGTACEGSCSSEVSMGRGPVLLHVNLHLLRRNAA
jgi:hypothetical protein